MTRYVIDAPTLLQLVADGLPVPATHRLVAPAVIRSQALELLFHQVRRGELTERVAMTRHDAFTGLKIRLLADRVSRRTAWTIARDHGWDSLRDAEYLAVTRLQADALITVDPRLAERAVGVVPVAPIAELMADPT